MGENLEHYRNQIHQARTEIKNLRQQLTALKHEHLKEIKLIKSALNGMRCNDCAATATTIIQNNLSSPSSPTNEGITYKPIGYIDTSFQNKRAVPRQPSILSNARGTVVIDFSVFSNPSHALSGLEEFSHMWIIFHFHMTESNSVPAKVAPPRLGGERRGVFSTRSPHRPCPIGLSLVKIHSIEDNKIHFQGVDMVSGTPVLDIKPYIPQYDCPTAFPELALTRPPTEGISDALDVTIPPQSRDDSDDSVSPRLANPLDINTSPSRSPYEDLPSPDNNSNMMTPISPSPDSPSSGDMLDGARSSSRGQDTERGAPDGQERFTPPHSAQMNNLNLDGIRIAPWISNPPSQVYEVRFTDDAMERLAELIGDRAETFKSNIQSLLSDDPRSQYVRNRYPNHEYSCVLEDVSISCIFDAGSSLCTIIAIRSAEELQA